MSTLNESLTSLRNQIFQDFEIICIDDGSSDDSLHLLEEAQALDSRIRILTNTQNLGIVSALNKGLENVQGEYVARMDSDDISLPNRFAYQLHYLDSNKDVSILGSNLTTFGDLKSQWVLPPGNEQIRANMIFQSAIMHPTVMFRSELIENPEFRYREEFRYGAEDLDLWTRVSESHNFANAQLSLLRYRVTQSSMTKKFANQAQENLEKVLASYLQKLNIEFSESDLRIHMRIAQWHEPRSIRESDLMLTWMDTLQNQFSENRRLDQTSLKSIIETRRQEILKWQGWENSRKSRIGINSTHENIATLEKHSPNGFKESLDFLITKYKKYLPAKFKHYTRASFLSFLKFIKKIRIAILITPFTIQGITKRIFKLRVLKKTKLKVAMGILAHERPEYLRQCLQSLVESDLSKVNLHLFLTDDGSKDPAVYQILCEYRVKLEQRIETSLHMFAKGENNAGQAINRFLKLVPKNADYDFIGWSDPDAIYSHDWQDSFYIASEAYARFDKLKLGPFSSFNSSNEIFHQPYGTLKTSLGSIVLKRQMGMLNYFYPKHMAQELLEFQESPDDETLKTIELEVASIKNFCTFDSYVEHIGQYSVLDTWRAKAQPRADYGLNLVDSIWPISIEDLDTVGVLKRKGAFYSSNINHDLGPLVDVIILCHQLDSEKLNGCVNSIRKNFHHRIGEIKVIAPDDPKIKRKCQDLEVTFVDESIFQINYFEDYAKLVNVSWSRGWIWQQLIKLQLDKICENDYIYLIDVDTRIVQPIHLFMENKIVLLKSEEWHLPYFELIKRILPDLKLSNSSFIVHQMLIKGTWLEEIRESFEKISNVTWERGLLDQLDFSELNCMSEFEIIGTWAINRHADSVTQGFWFGHQSEKMDLNQVLQNLRKKRYKNSIEPVIFQSVHNRDKWRKVLPKF
jgi:glycosyltransferase involved in cell wall biosynthesis